jgi:uncharacterized membrane protein (DUF373 family)
LNYFFFLNISFKDFKKVVKINHYPLFQKWSERKTQKSIQMEKLLKFTINTLIVLLTVVMIYSLLEIILITIRTIVVKNEIINFLHPTIDKNNLFISTVQGLIAAVLLVTILIEVIESLREYKQKDSINYTKVIVEIAIIAVVRHVLIMDFEHVNGNTLFGISSLIFVLGLFYLQLNNKLKFGKNE